MPANLSKVTRAIEPRVFRALLGLPPSIQKRLAGTPMVLDGQSLDPET